MSINFAAASTAGLNNPGTEIITLVKDGGGNFINPPSYDKIQAYLRSGDVPCLFVTDAAGTKGDIYQLSGYSETENKIRFAGENTAIEFSETSDVPVETEIAGGGAEITDGIVVKARDADGYATEVDFYGTVVQTYQFYCSSRTVGAFKNMARIVFKNAVTAIKAYAFHATGITQLPDLSHVSELASNAFRNCKALSGSVSLPTITKLLAEVFRECSGITAITAENATFAGESVFMGCTALQTAHLPKCATLGTQAFYTDTALTDVQIGSVGSAVTSCANTSFKSCTQTGFTITVYTTGAYADTALTNIRNGATNATIIIKAAEATTYSGAAYDAGDTMITSEVA